VTKVGFDFIIKHDGMKVQKAKVEDLNDFDSILDGLKEKFAGNKTPCKKRLM